MAVRPAEDEDEDEWSWAGRAPEASPAPCSGPRWSNGSGRIRASSLASGEVRRTRLEPDGQGLRGLVPDSCKCPPAVPRPAPTVEALPPLMRAAAAAACRAAGVGARGEEGRPLPRGSGASSSAP